MGSIYKVRDMINDGAEMLERADVDSPEFDAKALCSFLLGNTMSRLPLAYDDPVACDIRKEYSDLIKRRAEREPLQYITGEQDFMGITLKVDDRVLIPRFDTEILVEQVDSYIDRIAGTKPESGRMPVSQTESGKEPASEQGKSSSMDRQAEHSDNVHIKVLDLGTGSGAIGLAIGDHIRKLVASGTCKENLSAMITLADISDDALAVALSNAESLDFDICGQDHCGDCDFDRDRGEGSGGGASRSGGDCDFAGDLSEVSGGGASRSGGDCDFADDISEGPGGVKHQGKDNVKVRTIISDMFSSLKGEIFDIIVSNPPYIPTGDIEGLASEVKDHEPATALDGGEDGLWPYRIIASEAKDHLKCGGILALEIGYDQAETVAALLDVSGEFTDIKVVKDLAGLDRVIIASPNKTED